jgi:hypothetical protein
MASTQIHGILLQIGFSRSNTVLMIYMENQQTKQLSGSSSRCLLQMLPNHSYVFILKAIVNLCMYRLTLYLIWAYSSLQDLLENWSFLKQVGCITRLVPQKGVHLIRHAIYKTAELGGQFILLGSSPVPNIQVCFLGHTWNLKEKENSLQFLMNSLLIMKEARIDCSKYHVF